MGRRKCFGCLSLCFLIFKLGGHFFGSAQVDGDSFLLHFLALDCFTEFLEGCSQGNGQSPGIESTVANVGVALERIRSARDQ